MATLEEMKQEALERMKALRLSKQCIKAFERGKVWMSEGMGALYDTEDIQDLIDDFMKDGDRIVFHVIHTYTDFGDLYSLLYVHKYDSEWPEEREYLKDGYVTARTINVDYPSCSDSGDIVVRPSIGGLVRIG